MARNKYPEQTLEQILNVSAKLFTEKGFEKTSIQDIIDELGMSKGAIYHHFKSKEDILDAVMEKQFNYAAQMMDDLIQHIQAPNVREKLISILENVVADEDVHSIDGLLSTQMKNPQFVVRGIKAGVKHDAPILAQIMADGKQDGSIITDYPIECAEVFLLLVNIWINPTLFDRQTNETLNRLKFLQQMMRLLGADIVSDNLIQKIVEHHNKLGGYQPNE
ncbi:TetR/AcrR family transcriptional regulator [Paenibacillus tarimensis]|uniref:TetR/AcrR family transcriptional regulator n=1 Tax=Paenibacillus tarimensis TaxID=416012 RepID=UPI001F48FAE7|nr:TetR/AcrR family transcriptional regulator [Paenibacillus tarimensis]MCF2942961.1 TetR/AcrR family transcriptional regulator [Paenibacillus tarimensis]